MENALDGLRTRFCPPTQNFGQILGCPPPPPPPLPTKCEVGGSQRWWGDGKEAHLPWHFGFNEIHRPLQWPQTGTWYSGLQENMHTPMVCDVPLLTSSPSLRISQISTLIPISRVVMNIINGIARGGSPCVLVPPSLAPEE